ncbi:MAG: pyruvate carboxylase [Lentisphaeria bacterium]|nr:pyruvate carboxylase [Lentisphaeria bacterium]
MRKIKKLLVANRSEIAIRVFRSASELGIRTVAIYTHEDRYALHRFKADEAYQIGSQGEPIKSYLNIQGIIQIAKDNDVDAIHPGYGFLSENPEFAQACADNGIYFVGPSIDVLNQLGDKTSARVIADKAQVPILSGSKEAIKSTAEGEELAANLGYPIILKAAHGGGGRGMRVVREAADFAKNFEQAQRESLTAFGSPDIFIEKFIENARHIEVQLLGDKHGNLVHLWERDCSVQRRHQKVIEIAPAPNLDPDVREALCQSAISIGKAVDYTHAGTVEFLLDADTNKFYFIEVNPRIQVEHTVTEEVTGFDIVKSQILVTEGLALNDPEIGMESQELIHTNGFALQCRVTTEDPANNFLPDYGRVAHYRSASGMGVRLDAGSAFSGAVVNPFYDSMLVKVSVRGRRFIDAVNRMERTLHEFRIRGVKTNIPFLHNVLTHPTFVAGETTTRFIDKTPELFEFPKRRNRANRILSFLGGVLVNGNELVKDRPIAKRRDPVAVPAFDNSVALPKGTRDVFKELGAQKFSQWILDQEQLMFTDTTFRDAHQSLLATRMRTYDMVKIARAYAHMAPQLFSLEMWGGATFDTSMRFLKESPWDRLVEMRKECPNILFQMLMRASSTVGYKNYPDNVVKLFVKEAVDGGVDVFRIFDALNYLPNMQVPIEEVNKAGAIAEGVICYTGDILDPERTKYDLKYYVGLAKELEKMGATILCIKDMAGLCKPEAARILVKALKDEVGLPIHFHTHDTAGIQAASIFNGNAVGLDIADAAMAPFSGGTAQPNLNTVAESLRLDPRGCDLDINKLDEIAEYWRSVREFYTPFESEIIPASGDLYKHEMPGGQYTNLFQQARALGLADQWSHVCKLYAEVNQLFGDIVKVTPSSKAVGDMALFMVANELTTEDVLDESRELAFPASVIDLIGGMMGMPPGGFPPAVVSRILRGDKPLADRPGALLEPADLDAAKQHLRGLLGSEPSEKELVSYLLYDKVYDEYAKHRIEFGDVSKLATPNFLYGLEANEEIAVDIESGKRLIIKFLTISEPNAEGNRTVFFELNGQPRDVTVPDLSLESGISKSVKADPEDPMQVGSSMPGMVVGLAVKAGDNVKKGQKLLVLEAMKMESTIYAEQEGVVKSVQVSQGSQVETGDLLLTLE